MVSLQLFGGVALLVDEGPVTGPAVQRRRLALLAVLAASPSPGVSRDKLIAYFWPEDERERARHFLADSVFTLRKALGKEAILTVGDDLQLNPEVVEADVRAFHRALAAGDPEGAAALYRGPLLDGFFCNDAPDFERWVEEERDRLARRYAEALEELARGSEGRGDPERAVHWWRRLAAHDPLSSRVALGLMRALAAAGDRARAIQHGRVHAALLRAELDTGPDPEVEEEAARLARLPDPPPEPPRIAPDPAPEPAPVTPSMPIPQPSPAVAVAAAPRRNLRLALPALAIVLLAFAAAALLRRDRGAASGDDAAAETTTIAVLPFTVRGDPDFAYLEEGLATLLSTSLNGAGEVRTVDPNVLLSRVGGSTALPPDAAAEIAGELDADLYLLGSVVASAGRLRIVATLYDADDPSAPVLSVPVEGREEELSPLVDRISRQILAGRLSGPAERLAQVALRTTDSLSALKAFLQGERDFRAARYDAASGAFREAVRIDPSFALAHYRLSASEEWSFRFTDARAAAQDAWELSERLSARDQALIAAWRSFLNGDADAAERAYDAILTDEPFNVEAWSGLGEVRAHYNAVRGRRVDEAIPAFDRVLTLAPRYGEARFHLLELAAGRGERVVFDSLLAGVDPGSPQLLAWRAARALAWGTPAEAEAVPASLRGAEEVVVGIAAVRSAAHFRDLAGAELLTRLLADPARPHSWRAASMIMQAQLALARADRPGADRHLAAAAALEPDWSHELRALTALLPLAAPDEATLRALRAELEAWSPGRSTPETAFFFATHADAHPELRLYLLAMLGIRLGDDAAVERYTRELRRTGRTLDAGDFTTTLVLSIEAHRAAARGDRDAALRFLGDTPHPAPLERIALSPFFSGALDRYLHAELLRQAGRRDEALAWYASLTDGPDILFWAAAHRRQSELLAAAGRHADARRHADLARNLLATSLVRADGDR